MSLKQFIALLTVFHRFEAALNFPFYNELRMCSVSLELQIECKNCSHGILLVSNVY